MCSHVHTISGTDVFDPKGSSPENVVKYEIRTKEVYARYHGAT